MRINIIYESGDTDHAYKSVFHNFAKYCVENIKHIDINILDSRSFVKREENCKYGRPYLILENPDNKKYFLVSYWDRLIDVAYHYRATNFDLENCVGVITSAGTHNHDAKYTPINFNYTPFSYILDTVQSESTIEQLYSTIKNKSLPDRLSFRGYLYWYDVRRFLSTDSRFNVIDCRADGQYKQKDAYLEELASSSVNLSLNGAAEICHRDLEILGVGSALFRFELTTKFYNPLIPNYHYISVPHSDILPQGSERAFFTALSNRLYDRYQEIKNQSDFIEFVAKNGRQWYLENATVESNIKLLTKLIDFDKLV